MSDGLRESETRDGRGRSEVLEPLIVKEGRKGREVREEKDKRITRVRLFKNGYKKWIRN